MTAPLFGGLGTISPLWTVAAVLAVGFLLSFFRARFQHWILGGAVLLWLWAASAPVWGIYAALALILNLDALRRQFLTKPLMRLAAALDLLPTIGETERVALEAGTSWLEADILAGRLDFEGILAETYPELRPDERAFLDGPVEELCRLVSDWEVHEEMDLPAEVWDYIREERFLGMAIPSKYGGLGFSANGMAAVIGKLGSRSVTLAVDVMVPNSLGPGELLVHYGTEEQKAWYLPRLARGEEIPCFALTEPEAGSDATALRSEGVVFRDRDGDISLRLNWQKRYITMAPAATVIGLAFRLRDPEDLLGQGPDPGITVALVPADRPGVELGRRHDPLKTPFLNGPTEGEEVVIPASQIIGGADQAGNGWRMLSETLAAGRGIFIPALNNGGAKLLSRVTGAYSQVRQQFGLPIGRFEGVEELLAPIGGLTYLNEALTRFTCGRLDQGKKPAVISAIAKYHSSEFNRRIVNHSMDLLGGAGIVLGPRNLVGPGYMAAPIGITVEGSNILTRSLIIFGQGLIRSHPYAYEELQALEAGDAAAFDRAIWPHCGQLLSNLARASIATLTRGRIFSAPRGGQTADYYRRLAWSASLFALLADIGLVTLGGSLKRREKISGRFADALSWIFLALCGLRRFEADGSKEEHLPLLRWSLEHAFAEVHEALTGILRNYPVPGVSWLFWVLAMALELRPIGRGPSDELGRQVAESLRATDGRREWLTEGIYVPEIEGEPLAVLERAFDLAVEAAPLYGAIREAVRSGRLEPDRTKHLAARAHEMGVIDNAGYDLLLRADAARRQAVAVDSFDPDEMPTNLSAVNRRARAVEAAGESPVAGD